MSDIINQESWYEDNGKTKVVKTTYESGMTSLHHSYFHDLNFNKNIKRGFILKSDSKVKLFLHMFLAYSAFAMMIFTYILQDIIR